MNAPGALLALFLGGVALAGCGKPAPAFDTPDIVVWIVVDTLRADALEHSGLWSRFEATGEGGIAPSPHLDRFAMEDAFVFERAYAVAPWTAPSLVSQSTGQWPFEHGVLRLLQPVPLRLVTVPEVFRAAGWRTGGVTTNFVARALEGFDQGFERFDDTLAQGHEGSTVDAALAVTLQQVDEFGEDSARKRFLWALWFEPHWRYERHPGLGFGPQAASGGVDGSESLADLRRRAALAGPDGLSDRDRAVLRGLYQSEVAAIDRAFGRLRAELEVRGLWERALVVFTADHGEELLERGWLGHTTGLSEALVRVPLLIKPPGPPRPARIAARVSQVDLGPAVLEWAGLDPAALGRAPGSPSLAPLLADPTGAPPRDPLLLHVDFAPILHGDQASTPEVLQWGVVDARRGTKWVVDHMDPGGAPRGRLYDLERDPHGETDLSNADPFPAAARALAERRGLVPEPLGARNGAEQVPRLPASTPR